MEYRLIQGDCISVMDTLKKEGFMADIAFTSPPYNRKRDDKYANYSDTKDDYLGFLIDATDRMLAITRDYAIFNIQATYYNKKDVYRYIGHYADLIQQTFIWEKSNPVPSQGNNITNAYEYFFILGRKAVKAKHTYTKNHITTSVGTTGLKIHKAIMKQEVADWFFANIIPSGAHVIDPFMGTATTGIACMKNGNDFTGIELDSRYLELSRKRLETYMKSGVDIVDDGTAKLQEEPSGGTTRQKNLFDFMKKH